MRDWARSRDDLLRQLREHASGCSLCEHADPGVRIHNTCTAGIVLLTDWFLAKQYASGPTTHQPTTTEATP